jgi:lipoyl(octanoyl) transferase
VQAWRWLESGAGDGATQMSVDAALMQNPSGTAAPTFRVYRWRPHCISLGFHQSQFPIHFERCRSEGVDVVRRPTGGRAVFHSDEITYAVVIPRDSEWYARTRHELYRVISEGITRGLRDLGLPAVYSRRQASGRADDGAPKPVSCFSSTVRWEITLDGRKLVGSAQRITVDGFLQHGSILMGGGHARLMDFLAGAEGRPESEKKAHGLNAVSIEEYSGRRIPAEKVAASLKAAMEHSFGARFAEGALTAEEKALADSSRRLYSIFTSKERDPS